MEQTSGKRKIEEGFTGYQIKQFTKKVKNTKAWKKARTLVKKLRPDLKRTSAMATALAVFFLSEGDFDKQKEGTAKNSGKDPKGTTLRLEDLPGKAVEIARGLMPEFGEKAGAEEMEITIINKTYITRESTGKSFQISKGPLHEVTEVKTSEEDPSALLLIIDGEPYSINKADVEFEGGLEEGKPSNKVSLERGKRYKANYLSRLDESNWLDVKSLYSSLYLAPDKDSGEYLLTKDDFNKYFNRTKKIIQDKLEKKEWTVYFSEEGKLQIFQTDSRGVSELGIKLNEVIQKDAEKISESLIENIGTEKITITVLKGQNPVDQKSVTAPLVFTVPANFSDSPQVIYAVEYAIRMYLIGSVPFGNKFLYSSFVCDENLPFPMIDLDAVPTSTELSKEERIKDGSIRFYYFDIKINPSFINEASRGEHTVGIKIGNEVVNLKIELKK